MSPSTPAPYDSVDIFLLNADGSKNASIGQVELGPGESVQSDGFRCRPYGTFCQFLTTGSRTDNTTTSWIYNVTAGTAAVLSKTPVPGCVLHDLHVDTELGAAYSVCLNGSTASVVRIVDGQTETMATLDAYMCDGCTVRIGDSTQCSDIDHMWIGVSSPAHENDVLVEVNLATKSIANITYMIDPLPVSLWASCDDATKVNVVGGATMLKNGTLAAYGRVVSGGFFVADSSVQLPTSGLALTGLLSEPSVYDYFMALYPAGALPGSETPGYLAFGNFARSAGPSSLVLAPISYYLTGAARIS